MDSGDELDFRKSDGWTRRKMGVSQLLGGGIRERASPRGIEKKMNLSTRKGGWRYELAGVFVWTRRRGEGVVGDVRVM